MKFNISSKTLYSCASAVSKIINAKNTLSILNNFKLELKDNRLSITASDSENFLEGRVDLADSEGEGCFCVDARRFVELLKDLPEVGITVSVSPEDNYAITVDYENGEFKFMGFDGSEFPLPDEADLTAENPLEFIAPASKFIRAVDNTLFAVGNDELRPLMMGIYWDLKPDRAVFVATDTRKLVKFVDEDITPGGETNFILPLKSAVVMKNVFTKDEDMKVIVRDKGVTFESVGFTFNSRFLKGRYPDYERVIPRDNPFTLTVNRQSLASSVRRVCAFGKTDNGLIRFKLQPDSIVMKATENALNSSARETVAASYEGNEMIIGFSGPYVSEILSTISSNDVVIRLADPSRPGVFEPSENKPGTTLVIILMPMLVNQF